MHTPKQLAALLMVLGMVPNPSSAAQNPVASTSNLILRILFTPTYLAGVTTAGSMLASSGPAAKRAIAAAALEDAAEFYASGRLTGILPAVMAQVRDSSPTATELNDAQLVDLIVDAVSGADGAQI